MLTKYTVKGFKSFRDESTVDLHSTNYKILSDTNINKDGILKAALFVGANASGKSNIIIALKFLLDMLFAKHDISLSYFPCFFSKEKLMFLQYEFLIEGKEIVYTIEYDKYGEQFKENLKLDNKLLLDRIGKSAESNITENQIFNDISSNSLFLREIYFNTKFRGNSILQKWFDFLTNSIYIDLFSQDIKYYKGLELGLIEYLSVNGTDEINSFFNEFNFNQTIEYVKESKGKNITLTSDNEAIIFKRKGIDEPVHFDLESVGNKTLLILLPLFFHVIKNGGILILDEFSSGFHNQLEELLVKYFMEKSKNAQVIFVSHSTNLLTNSLLRPDQMYSINFIEGKGSVITKRFSSEKPREAQNLEKMYLGGVFNGLPNYKEEHEAQ